MLCLSDAVGINEVDVASGYRAEGVVVREDERASEVSRGGKAKGSGEVSYLCPTSALHCAMVVFSRTAW